MGLLGRKRLVLSVLFTLLLLSPLAIIGYLGLVALFALILPFKYGGILLRLIASFLIFYSFQTIIGAVLWLLNIEGLQYIPLLSGALVCILHIKYLPPIPKLRFNFVGLAVGLIVMLIPLLPLLQSRNFATLVQLFSYQGDNLSHLELINADIKKQGYVYYSLENIRPYAYQTLSGYPQGWHLNIAILQDYTSRLLNINGNSYKEIGFFYIICSMLFGVLALATHEIMLVLGFGKNRSRLKTILASIAAALVTLALFLGTFMTLFAYGFQTHLASLLLVLIISFVLIELTRESSVSKKRLLFIFAGLLAVGIALTWQVIVLPVALVLLAILFSQKLIGTNVKTITGNWKFLLILIGLAVAASFQFFIQIAFGNEATSIVQPGLSPELLSSFLLLFFAAALMACIFMKKNKLGDFSSPLSYMLIGAGIFSLLLYIILEVRIGEQRYYYFKSTFTIVLLGLVILGGFLTNMLAQLSKQLDFQQKIVLFLCIVFSGLGGIALNLSGETISFYEKRLAGMDRPLAETLAAELSKPAESRPKVLAIGSCIPDQDYKASRIAQSLSDDPVIKTFRVNNPFDKNLKYTDISTAFIALRPEKETVVLSHDTNVLKKIQAAAGKDAKIKAVDLDPYGPPKTPSLCPNFVEYKLN